MANFFKTSQTFKQKLTVFVCLLSSILVSFEVLHAEEYQSQKDFLVQSLGVHSDAKMLWVSSQLRSALKAELKQDLSSARVRYWEKGEKRVWILEEIGRDKPITMGFVIRERKIVQLRVLAFRESRGYEVRYPRFTSQFSSLGLELGSNGLNQLSDSIDNVTGATLSVNAVKKAAKLALYLNQQVELANLQ